MDSGAGMPRCAWTTTEHPADIMNQAVNSMYLQVVCVLFFSYAVNATPQPNPPNWPASVHVFSPGDPTIQKVVNGAYAENGGQTPPNNGQFSGSRFAFLFAPGVYNVDIPVGFYTHVIGLGESPDAVTFTGQKGVFCEEGATNPSTGALDTFWRAAENFQHASSGGMLWAVSQGTALRRLHVLQSLTLYQYVAPYPNAGYASGGYLSNSQIDGKLNPGSQQQWFTRNSNIGSWSGGNWNMVFSGVVGAPASHCSNVDGDPIVTVGLTPVVAEKPFLTVNSAGLFTLNVPVQRHDSTDVDWSTGTQFDFSHVYVASNTSDTASSINQALSGGLHVVLSPGIYQLDAPLVIQHDNQVLMGLGYATLVPTGAHPVIVVKDVSGVRIAGPILLQAGSAGSPALLQWGSNGGSSSANYSFMYDVFARVGGPDTKPVSADVMVLISASSVVIDNSWLWRADHTVAGIVKNCANPCKNGLVVQGDYVHAYGLAVEHTLQDLVVWSGNNGHTIFFQSELPYDVTQAQYGAPGYVAYRVTDGVTTHTGAGIGVYTFFRDYNVTVNSGISCPSQTVQNFTSPLGVFLSGHGTMNHIINEEGASTSWRDGAGGVARYYCPTEHR